MFTGIIEQLGKVKSIENYSGIRCLRIESEDIALDTKIGDSIAVNGVCLTVTKIDGKILSFEVVSETLNNTNLKDVKINDKVNLERSLKLQDKLGGHLVSGHVDCLGIIRKKFSRSGTEVFEIAVPSEFSRNIVDKGSVALDGISLTVAKVSGNVLSVNVIPHTLKETTLGLKSCSVKLNVEFDVIGKYVKSFLKDK